MGKNEKLLKMVFAYNDIVNFEIKYYICNYVNNYTKNILTVIIV